MTKTETARRPEVAARPEAAHEPVPTWRNTRPRGNPETDRRDFERSVERMEAVLGR